MQMRTKGSGLSVTSAADGGLIGTCGDEVDGVSDGEGKRGEKTVFGAKARRPTRDALGIAVSDPFAHSAADTA